ncbi:hypothetical protein L484_002341 [Morus notabilis]|uniref:Uncharacterized protein n=1 Tax=Morus notabilis TaxID=981085 RepID=W9RR67_9ROSA|nr:hypothetical protein L484_002341 [Morus notabilis]
MKRLAILDLSHYTKLFTFGINVYNIKSLQYVDLSCCSKLQRLPVLTSVGFCPKIKLEITYSGISKIIDWHYGFSLFPMLDPSRTSGHERITVKIERRFNIIIFQVVGCATPQNIA